MRCLKATAPLWPDLVGGHRGWRINGWMDGWVTTPGIFQPDRWGIHSQSRLHALIDNERTEAVPGRDI